MYAFRVKQSSEIALKNIVSFFYIELGKIQDGRWWKSFYDIIKMPILKTKFYLLALYKNKNTCYTYADMYGYKR